MDELKSFFINLAVQSVWEQYTKSLREYANSNTENKKIVIDALELFLQELKNSK